MTTSLYSYYDFGLRSLNAARLGLAIAGDNISNVNTPGYARRRLDLETGMAIPQQGGWLDRGVNISGIRRMEDRFLQANLEREKASLAGSEEQLRGLRNIESLFGSLEGENILDAYSRFSNAFTQLAAQPSSGSLREEAVGAANQLAGRIRNTYTRLQAQQRTEDGTIKARVADINRLSSELESLNRQIFQSEADGTTAAPFRDRRGQVVEALVELTGGVVSSAESGKLIVSFQGGPTLVNNDSAIALRTTTDARGLTRVVFSGNDEDLTDRIQGGELGALLSIRDEGIAARLADLDALAEDLITRGNALTTASFDLNGDPGGPLFEPDPPPASGAAGLLAVAANVLNDPSLLAVSATGAVDDGTNAVELARLQETDSAILGSKTPVEFLADALTSLGTDIAQADVDTAVAQELVDTLEARRQAVTGVSLDEEAIELVRFQQAFEAAARFMQVLNEVTEIAINI